MKNQISVPTIEEINEQLKPLIALLNDINNKVEANFNPKKYYRNKDLKAKFGLADNTIISYRDKNIIPYTFIGEIYYYPVHEIDKILEQNSNFDLFKSNVA
jgi:hypothetical protein